MWSRIKKRAKEIWRGVKTVVRWVVRGALTLAMAGINVFDLLFGFLNWPPKNLTLHIAILSTVDPFDGNIVPVVDPQDPALKASIDQAERILRQRFNVKLRPYASHYVQVVEGLAPKSVLKPSCCDEDAAGQEFLEQGEWYAGHTAGWVGMPISPEFPLTAFVVDEIKCKIGCSLGPLTDYIVISRDGVHSSGPRLNNSTLMHEVGHACHLPHWWVGVRNLMWKDIDRGDEVKWWQRNLFRSSRHVTYW